MNNVQEVNTSISAEDSMLRVNTFFDNDVKEVVTEITIEDEIDGNAVLRLKNSEDLTTLQKAISDSVLMKNTYIDDDNEHYSFLVNTIQQASESQLSGVSLIVMEYRKLEKIDDNHVTTLYELIESRYVENEKQTEPEIIPEVEF